MTVRSSHVGQPNGGRDDDHRSAVSVRGERDIARVGKSGVPRTSWQVHKLAQDGSNRPRDQEKAAQADDPGETDEPGEARSAALGAVLENLIAQQRRTLETIASCPDAAHWGWYRRLDNMEWSRRDVAAELQQLLTDVVHRKYELLLRPPAAAGEQRADPPSEAPYAALFATWALEDEHQEPFGHDNRGSVVSVESSLRELASALAAYEALWH